jgi:alginate O-acetyltransferase complex protein AlgI
MTTGLLPYGIGVLLLWLIAMRLRSVATRQALYLAASWLFYFTWGGWVIVFLIFSSLINYALGEWLKKSISARRLWAGIVFNLTFLSVFKYLPLLGAVAPAGSPFVLLTRMIFPLGVSFWTFQALSYLLELYREEEMNPTLVEFCLYMAFWPTVLQGPICRMSSMLPQFRQDWAVGDDDLKTGVRRISIGVLMSVLANVMAGGLYAGSGVEATFDSAFSSRNGLRLGGIDVWFLIIAYGFQLYFSFCGWSHIMIGAGRLFGIQLQENFNRPYLSTTISVFWTRWHMSLSFWIRDFLFLPLATVRRAIWWRNLSLVIAMFAFGLWHRGTFLLMLWGTYHGILLVLHRQWQEMRKRLGFEWTGVVATAISWWLTFSAVCLGYVFFRAENTSQAFAMLKALASIDTYRHLTLDHSFYLMTLLAFLGYFAVIGVGVLLDRLREAIHSWTETAEGVPRRTLATLFGALERERWVWITPVVVVLALYLGMIFQTGQAETGPVMYALF